MIKIAIIGLGTVGGGVFEILREKHSEEFQVQRVVVKDAEKSRSFNGYQPLLSTYEEVIADEEIGVIVELINDEEVAFRIAELALAKGKTVISGSKKMLAKNLKQLQDTAIYGGGDILYEAAVCGSIPIILLLQQYFLGNKPQKIRTIANGTSNYILSQLWQTNATYDEIVTQAIQAGFAETDPTDDVAGYDVRSKLTLIILNAFHTHVSPELIPCFGIQHIKEHTISLYKSKLLKIKLLGNAFYSEGNLKASVIPEIVSSGNSFYGIEGEQNAVEIENLLSQQQFFQGKGAGRYPTTQAVLADLQALKSKRKNQIEEKSITQEIDKKSVELFYIDAPLQDLELLDVIKTFENHSFVKATIEEMEKYSKKNFIAKITIGVFEEYFG